MNDDYEPLMRAELEAAGVDPNSLPLVTPDVVLVPIELVELED